ncbi:hypothetical protein [Sphaerisporangium fuscum]|uniref:hypothetical protein n=1 Tax=Sphaerisporangium fuscum TaxID=2835868 RepID=UPI001BDC6123|nr:hypothetical protein [Sphaerisporangium fuscum]
MSVFLSSVVPDGWEEVVWGGTIGCGFAGSSTTTAAIRWWGTVKVSLCPVSRSRTVIVSSPSRARGRWTATTSATSPAGPSRRSPGSIRSAWRISVGGRVSTGRAATSSSVA